MKNSLDARFAHSRGFTVIELVVVAVVVAVLFGLLMAAIVAARHSAQRTACMDHLRQIGIAVRENIARAAGGAEYCTGATYPLYDGDPSIYGWVADLSRRQLPPAAFYCPVNPARITESLSIDSLRKAYAAGKLPPSVTADDDASLTEFQTNADEYGCNTNYCQVWTMARTDMLPLAARKGANPSDTLDRKNTIGPLRDRELLFVNTGALMLIADAMPNRGDTYEYAATITRGPIDPNDPRSSHDFSNIGLVHGSGASLEANVLFADGHVESIADVNADGVLNRVDLEGRAIYKGIRFREGISRP